MNLYLKGTGLREVSTSLFPLVSLPFHKRHLLSESEIQPSAALVLCEFYHNFTKLKSVNSVFCFKC